jgi:hypothetical protein
MSFDLGLFVEIVENEGGKRDGERIVGEETILYLIGPRGARVEFSQKEDPLSSGRLGYLLKRLELPEPLRRSLLGISIARDAEESAT